MKASILLLFLFLNGLTGYAQLKIEGIGKFKIGQTKPTDLPLLTTELGFNVFRLLPDLEGIVGSDSTSTYFSSLCPNSEVYFIRKTMVEGVLVDNVYLTFYRGKLISFHCDGSARLVDVFKLKYGTGQITTTSNYTRCSRPGSRKKIIWQNSADASVFVESIESTSYNSDCRQESYHSILVGNGALENEAAECNTVTVAKLKEHLDEEKKKRL